MSKKKTENKSTEICQSKRSVESAMQEYIPRILDIADKTIERYLAVCKSENFLGISEETSHMKDLIAAMIEIGRCEPDVLDKLKDLAKSKNVSVRMIIAIKLEKASCSEMFDILLGLLDDNEYNVQLAAIRSIANCAYYFY